MTTVTFIKSDKKEFSEEDDTKRLAEFLYCLIEIKMDEDRKNLEECS